MPSPCADGSTVWHTKYVVPSQLALIPSDTQVKTVGDQEGALKSALHTGAPSQKAVPAIIELSDSRRKPRPRDCCGHCHLQTLPSFMLESYTVGCMLVENTFGHTWTNEGQEYCLLRTPHLIAFRITDVTLYLGTNNVCESHASFQRLGHAP